MSNKTSISINFIHNTVLTSFFVLLMAYGFTQAAFADQNETDRQAISRCLEDYFNGRGSADTDLLANAFYANASLDTVDSKGQIQHISFADYLDVVKNKGPVKVTTTVVSIDINQTMAVAQTRFDYGPVIYNDYLTLLKTSNGWKITYKAFFGHKPD